MISLLENINMRVATTMRVDAQAAAWVEFSESEEAPAAVDAARKATESGKFIIAGGGSNLLFCKNYEGAVLHPALHHWEAKALENGKMEITAGAGIDFDKLVEHTCAARLWGLENLSLIPGSVGGAAVQNAGAYGVEAGDCITGVYVWDMREKKFDLLTRGQLEYGYRNSVFKTAENAGRYIVLKVRFELSPEPRPVLGYGPLKSLEANKDNITPDDVRAAVIEIRNSKLPAVEEVGSAGSFFKNPVLSRSEWDSFRALAREHGDAPHFNLPDGRVKVPAAWLIEKSGWKGRTLGNAGVWHIQPLILINATGKASGADIVALERAITADVSAMFGITLEPEVVHIY